MARPPETHTEVERKYDVPARAKLPDLCADGLFASASTSVEPLDATYYDTADANLFAHRVVLRRREGGHDAGWHIKSPSGRGRNEFRWPLGSGTSVPKPVRHELRGLIGVQRLRPLARIRTTRTAVTLRDAAGAAQAELSDDVVVADDLRAGTTRRWREWEVEIAEGIPADRATRLLDQIERRLRVSGAEPSAAVSKLARAIGQAPGPKPDRDDADPSDTVRSAGDAAGATASELLAPALRSTARTLLDSEDAVRHDGEDAVHQARVQVRTLRSLLRVYRPLLSDRTVLDLDSRLKRYGAQLGQARDAEVRARFLEIRLRELGSSPELDGLQRRLEAGSGWTAYRDRHRELVRHMDRPRHRRLRHELELFELYPPFSVTAAQRADRTVLHCLRAATSDVERAAVRAGSATDDREAALHEVRKAARRLRYAAAALKGTGLCRPEDLKAVVSACKRLQDALGDHRDDTLLADRVEEYVEAARTPEQAELLRRLRDLARSHAAEDLLEYGELLDDLFASARTAFA